MMENGLKLHVVGIIAAAKAMFSRAGFDLANFREELLEKGKDSSCLLYTSTDINRSSQFGAIVRDKQVGNNTCQVLHGIYLLPLDGAL